MSVVPVELRRTDSLHLSIRWSDGLEHAISYRQLRDQCPCATCRHQASEAPADNPPADNPLRVLAPAETVPLTIINMVPVGNYAYNIQFSDGHNTGIFTFELLRKLAESNVE